MVQKHFGALEELPSIRGGGGQSPGSTVSGLVAESLKCLANFHLQQGTMAGHWALPGQPPSPPALSTAPHSSSPKVPTHPLLSSPPACLCYGACVLPG